MGTFVPVAANLSIGGGDRLKKLNVRPGFSCVPGITLYNARLDFQKTNLWSDTMPRPQNNNRERREKTDKFQTFNRPKIKVAKTTASGEIFIDYKDTESLKKMVSGNGKILSRKRTGATAMEQRMLAKAVKRSRYMALLPYVTSLG
jgi:small subunit ribosomal protein S18